MEKLFDGPDGITKHMTGKSVCEVNITKVVSAVEKSLAGVYFGSRMVDSFKKNC